MSNYVIVDLEMCHVPNTIKRKNFNCKSELIQIGAVLVDSSLTIIDEFVTYVSPEFGVIDKYIENLTGISKQDVQNAPKFEEAIGMFLDWLPDDVTLVSWSNNDQVQIKRESEAKGIVSDRLACYLETWIDCQKTFKEKMDSSKNYKLSEALIIADIDSVEGEHDALIDAKNTARLFVKMECEQELILNSCYFKHPKQTTYQPFAALLANYTFSEC